MRDIKKAGLRGEPQEPATGDKLSPLYSSGPGESKLFSGGTGKKHQRGKRDSVAFLQKTLGQLLVALHWPTTEEDEKPVLLFYVDGLTRRLVDLRRRGN
jgi:hypothetical protein